MLWTKIIIKIKTRDNKNFTKKIFMGAGDKIFFWGGGGGAMFWGAIFLGGNFLWAIFQGAFFWGSVKLTNAKLFC